MRVIHVFDSIHPHAGGAQQVLFLWLEELKRRGIEVLLLCDTGIHRVSHTLSPKEVYALPSFSLGALMGGRGLSLFFTPEAKQHILDFRPDIIHLHEQVFLSQQVLAFAHEHHIPVLNSFHLDANEFAAKGLPASLFVGKGKFVTRLLETAQLEMLRGADWVTVPTAAYVPFVSQRTPRPVHHLTYPVDGRFFPQRKKISNGEPKHYLTVSRLVSEKKVDLLLRSFALLPKDVTLAIVGDGSDRQQLQRLAEELGLSARVRWCGWLSHEELRAVFAQHDIFISASTMESLGLVYLEALLAGLPCVVADYAVSREVVPAAAGVFVNGAEPETWANAVRTLSASADRYKQLIQGVWESRELLLKYHPEQSTAALQILYQRCLAEYSASLPARSAR